MLFNFAWVVLFSLHGNYSQKMAPVADKQSALILSNIKTLMECQLACDQTYRHCAMSLVTGQKKYANAMEACLGCADVCKLTNTISARKNPLAKHTFDCCLKCCTDTATACELFPDDEVLARCAKSCRECIKACTSMAEMK